MHVGIFLEERRRGVGDAATFRETLDLADAAEAWGLDGIWLGEIHFNGVRSVQSAPLALASFIAARSRRIRIGTAVQVLPLANPLRIAEEAATVDHLTQGRFDFGVGRSGSPRAYDALGIPYGESQARFLEALDVIREAWKGKPFSYAGKFHRFENVTVSPTPYQVPYPPIRVAANSEETFSQVGRLGLAIFVGVRDHDIPSLRIHLQAYRKAWQDAGHSGQPDAFLRIPIYAADSEEAAHEEPRENITFFYRRHVDIIRSAVGRAGGGPAARRQALAEYVAGMTYEDILKTRVAFGTAASLVDRLNEISLELSLSGIVAELNPGGLLSTEQMRRTLRILTHEVVPRLG
ncbi:MAG TPA: LLM class flavin-dependent oxidoreductase [Methylomirabilota bacterium]|jgi:alkanesulfonate monooxygenase SsuD/methylene tetrahydromethanopterin reductase-like flavin-dependent oxidoreductase (luciferase family)|nr:LLM class flavin-dependent oxidoreductase [Methylomirabilota bacterium]